MKSAKLSLFTLIVSMLMTSCDNTSTDIKDMEHGKTDNKISQNIKIEETEKEKLVDTKETANQNESYGEIVPYFMRAPSYRAYRSIDLPESNLRKVKSYFYNNVDSKMIKDKDFSEDGHGFNGTVDYVNNTSIRYSFKKEKSNVVADILSFNSTFRINNNFSESDKDNIYKILEISGVQNPEQFFQQLITSIKITEYSECIVQQKRAKYGMIELTACEADDVTILNLYNPN